VIAAYVALRDAALRKDMKATLSAMGFDAKQVAAIRGMEGIDADFAGSPAGSSRRARRPSRGPGPAWARSSAKA
jgi:hypothetical protein